MILFAFHALILLLLGGLIAVRVIQSGKYPLLGPLIGMVLLFAFHCLMWGESCTQCDLSNWVCIAELVLFWGFALWGVYASLFERAIKEERHN